MEKIIINMPHSLSVYDGHYADSGNMSQECPKEALLGSEIEPVKIGEISEGDFENGTGIEKFWFVIVQHGSPLLVETEKCSYNYGCQYMKNGGSESYKVLDLKNVENFQVEETEEAKA